MVLNTLSHKLTLSQSICLWFEEDIKVQTVVPDFILLSDFLSLCVCTQSPVIQKCVENIYSPTTALILPGSPFYMPGWSVSPPHITNYNPRLANLQACLIHFSPSLLILLKTPARHRFLLWVSDQFHSRWQQNCQFLQTLLPRPVII